MARRQPVQREIGSTLEMQQAFNTAPTAPLAVPGIQNANVPRQAPMTAELEFMGTRSCKDEIRETCSRRSDGIPTGCGCR
jgi:hypothetical protein